MEDTRFRVLLRSAFALSLATPAVIVAACEADYDATGRFATDGGGDRFSAEPGVPEAGRFESRAVTGDDWGCINDVDAAPVICSRAQELPQGTCPQRPGVCGSDGRTYCSAQSAARAGVTVVLNAACDLPCGHATDGGSLVCNAVTEYCRAAIMGAPPMFFECTAFAASPPDGGCPNHSCACFSGATS